MNYCYKIWFFNEMPDLMDISKGRKSLKEFNSIIEADKYIKYNLKCKIMDFISTTYNYEPENIEVIILCVDISHHIFFIKARHTNIEPSEHLFKCWARIYRLYKR